KGTRVDGIYTADPEKDPTDTRYDEITFDEVLSKNLNVMDMTAFTLCKENNLPIIVFDMNTPGNLERLLNGEAMGTLVSDGDKNGRHARKMLIDAKLGVLQPLVGNQPEQA
ncbi:MAG: pyrH, partial [Hymenobacter sp.]|nr:pyrH [Hymenobacter sp.]